MVYNGKEKIGEIKLRKKIKVGRVKRFIYWSVSFVVVVIKVIIVIKILRWIRWICWVNVYEFVLWFIVICF